MLRILIADDHDVVRTGIRWILEEEPGWQVCGEATDGHEAVELAKKLTPDIVVMDYFMPRVNGLDAARQIRRDKADQKILFLTLMDSEEVARSIVEAGAQGYVLKSEAAHHLVAGIKAVAHNHSYFTAKLSNLVLKGYLTRHTSTGQPIPVLTLREREILQLIAEGYVTKEVAVILGISVKTTETHRGNIMRKLNLHSVAELVIYAVRNNLVQNLSCDGWHTAAA